MYSSVLPIFGENLRILCELRSSVSQVARDLQVNRMQMRRYLSGESFPKPHQLKQFCDYFGVDARILTERLTGEQLAFLEEYGSLQATAPRNPAMQEAMDYIGDLGAFFAESHELPDGLYLFLARSLFQRDTLTQMHIQISTKHRARVVRTVVPKQYFEALNGIDANLPPRERELRGLVLRIVNGYMLQFYQTNPRRMTAVIFLEPSLRPDLASFEGMYMLLTNERKGLPRVTRCLLRRVAPTYRNIVKAAHTPIFSPFSEAPPQIHAALIRPVDGIDTP